MPAITLGRIVNGGSDYTAIPVPGSATYANEAAMALLVPPGGRLLVHSNGVYGDRLIEICEALGIATAALRTAPFTPPAGALFAAALHNDPAITHVMLVHCETSTGVLNPLDEVAALCRAQGKGLLVDAVASFGAIEIDLAALGADAVTLSSNKCMQGVSGVGWAVVRRAALEGVPPWTSFALPRSAGAGEPHGRDERIPLHVADTGRRRLCAGVPGA